MTFIVLSWLGCLVSALTMSEVYAVSALMQQLLGYLQGVLHR